MGKHLSLALMAAMVAFVGLAAWIVLGGKPPAEDDGLSLLDRTPRPADRVASAPSGAGAPPEPVVAAAPPPLTGAQADHEGEGSGPPPAPAAATEEAEPEPTTLARLEPVGPAPTEDVAGSSEEALEEVAEDQAPAGAPKIELLRVDAEGQTVLAGRAAEGTAVEVMLDDDVVGRAEAGRDGRFVAILDIGTSDQPRALVLRSEDRGAPTPAEGASDLPARERLATAPALGNLSALRESAGADGAAAAGPGQDGLSDEDGETEAPAARDLDAPVPLAAGQSGSGAEPKAEMASDGTAGAPLTAEDDAPARDGAALADITPGAAPAGAGEPKSAEAAEDGVSDDGADTAALADPPALAESAPPQPAKSPAEIRAPVVTARDDQLAGVAEPLARPVARTAPVERQEAAPLPGAVPGSLDAPGVPAAETPLPVQRGEGGEAPASPLQAPAGAPATPRAAEGGVLAGLPAPSDAPRTPDLAAGAPALPVTTAPPPAALAGAQESGSGEAPKTTALAAVDLPAAPVEALRPEGAGPAEAAGGSAAETAPAAPARGDAGALPAQRPAPPKEAGNAPPAPAPAPPRTGAPTAIATTDGVEARPEAAPQPKEYDLSAARPEDIAVPTEGDAASDAGLSAAAPAPQQTGEAAPAAPAPTAAPLDKAEAVAAAPRPGGDGFLYSAPVIILPSAAAEAGPTLVQTGPDALEVIQRPAEPEAALSLDRISYGEAGDVSVTGRGRVGETVRLYANAEHVGEARVGEDGSWAATLPLARAEDAQLLRFDAVDRDGDVTGRLETPFAYDTDRLTRELRLREVVVQRGDNLWQIAEQHYGDGIRYSVIFGANSELIRDPDLIYPGQVFSVPAFVAAE